MAKIIIIDDDHMLCNAFSIKLKALGHDVSCVHNIEEGLRETEASAFDVVYLDVRLPDGNGLDVLPVIRKSASEPEVIIMTGQGDPDGAELAIRNGAWDYIEKPSSINTMILPLVRALQYREMKSFAQKSTVTLKRDGIIGRSQSIKNCLDQVTEAAGSDASILLIGETGTGKELFAWAIHQNSRRASNNFVVVDCASLTETLVESMLFGYEKGAYTGADRAKEGLIKQADKGTLFLDEIGDLPLSIQKTFLRVLQEHRFRPLGRNHEVESDFRLVAATNRNLDEMVMQGHFRDDLLYRLRSFTIELPSLRERREDIPELITYHTKKICERYKEETKTLSQELMDMLVAYDWPGNVRELVAAMERILAAAKMEPVLIPRHLPIPMRIKIARASVGKTPRQAPQENGTDVSVPGWQAFHETTIHQMEKRYLQEVIEASGNNIKKACEISKLSRSRLYELLKKYEVSPPG